MLFGLVIVGAILVVGHTQPIWSPSGCGQSKYEDAGDMLLPSGFIVGGVDARPNEFPWQASIRRRVSDLQYCGAAIINTRWVLTGAQCLDGEAATLLYVTVGDWQRSAESDVRQTLNVLLLKLHELYDPRTNANDVGLLKVQPAIAFSENIQPVCAPNSDNEYTYYRAQLSGWGITSPGEVTPADILQYTTLNITTNAFCDNAYPRNQVTGDMICAYDNVGGIERDACQGDVGGPMTIKEADGTFRIVGIVSWGIGCASGNPRVSTRVSNFNDWITNFIENN